MIPLYKLHGRNVSRGGSIYLFVLKLHHRNYDA
jgi:hypothetical protein